MSIFFGKDEPPLWLSIIGLIIIVSFFLNDINFASFLGGIIAILCARQCYKWSRSINRKGYGAYFIGLLFSLLGLLFYYFFYKNRLMKIVLEKGDKPTVEVLTSTVKAKKVIKEYLKSIYGNEDYNEHYLEEDEDGFLGSKDSYIIYPDGKVHKYPLTCPKDELINEVIKTKFNVKKAIDNLVEEYEVNKEAEKIKDRNRKFRIKEKAEKKVYGKVKSKRVPINSEEKEAILRKFGNKCAVCSKTEGLHIHHKDKNPKNNKIDNLLVLCGVCHKKIHMKVR